jgi:hypothetical protein
MAFPDQNHVFKHGIDSFFLHLADNFVHLGRILKYAFLTD